MSTSASRTRFDDATIDPASSVLALQRAVGNAAATRLLRQVVTTQEVGRPGAGAAGGYEPGEKEASLTSPGGVESTKDGLLLFDFPVNKQFIKPEHQEHLRRLIKDLRWDSRESLFPIKEIIGFTDAVRRQGGNTALREDRATAVQIFLETRGAIEANTGVAVAAPADRFVATNETRAGRARNRSVLISTEAFLPPEPPPPKPTPEIKLHTKWAIGEIANVEPPLKEGISLNLTLFRVREDVPDGQRFVLVFAGGGPGLSADLTDLVKKVKLLSALRRFILKLIASGAIDADAITGDEAKFTTREPATKGSFFGQGLILHLELGPIEVQRVGLPMHTAPEAIDLGGGQIHLGAGAGAETGIFLPI